MVQSKTKLKILMVEDADSDIKILIHHLDSMNIPYELTAFDMGEKALIHLENVIKSNLGKEALPSLIILDIQLPGENGLLILERMKAITALKEIPIVVMSDSKDKDHILQTYRKGGVIFFSKSADPEAFSGFMTQLRITGRLG